MKRKVLSLLALLMTAVTGAWAQDDPVASGTCGSNVTWELTGTSPEYTLTISGADAMANYSSSNQPWNEYKANIKTVKVDDGVTAIGNHAFNGCTALTDVTIGSGVKTIGTYAFKDCSNLEVINIPDGVENIGNIAFSGCSRLKTVNLPASLQSINQNLFKDCTSLEEIVIPVGVMGIGQKAFEGCTNLREVTILSQNVRTIFPNSFQGVNSNLVIYVPADSKTYQNLSNAGFTNNMQEIPSTYTLTANEGKTGEFWATFYSKANYQAAGGVQVFKVNLAGTVITMTEITDRIVNRGQGVVLKSTSGSSITMTQITSNSVDDYSGNSLKGTMTSITTTEDNNYYVLNKGANGVGFYKLSASGTIGANKAYLTYSGSLAREFFSFNEATGISATLNDNVEMINDNVYDLQGRSVSQPTKGLYIVNGKKVIIK